MTPHDKPRFLAVLAGLAAVKPGNTKLTPEALEVWWMALREWDLGDFEAAAAHLLRTSEFMPNPYHFERLRKSGRQTAGEAWAAVLEYVRKGFWHWTGGGIPTPNGLAPEPPDPLTERVVRALGGYQVIAGSREDGLPFLERRFSEHYDAMQFADDTRAAVPQIAALPGPAKASRISGPQRAKISEALRKLGPLKPREDVPARYEP